MGLLGFAFRTGRLSGARWGVDVELARALKFDARLPPEEIADGFAIEDRHSALSITAVRLQAVSAHTTLGYVFGGFLAAHERDVFLTAPSSQSAASRRIEDSLGLTIGPALGLDLRFALTKDIHLVPSVRLLFPFAGDPVLIQTTVGGQWIF